jgi:hypothetical protein
MTSLIGNFEVDLDDDSKSFTNKKDGIIDRLKQQNLLKYGSLFEDTDIEFVMGKKQSSVESDEWQFLLLQLREVIKDQGFYVTSRGRDNRLYILLPHEMPLFNERKNKATFRHLKQRTRALHMIDQSILSSEHQKKLEFEIFRNASFEIEFSKNLKNRCR